jgi:thiol:disulfide interchange protein DsbD
MAITYAIVGMVIALIGSRIQAELQQPWIIILFSGIFVLLALSLFGFYELQLPATWRQRVAAWNHRQKGGTYFGVFLMGSLSTLIVSPCVSAPLVGVLAYIGRTGDVLLGAMALFAMGIGMGIPLLLIGVSADKLLPKAGPWMVTLERTFGIMMLGVAIWMLSRMIPGPITLFLWAILFIIAAIFLGVFSAVPARFVWLVKILSIMSLVYGMMLLVSSVEDGRRHVEQVVMPFTIVRSMQTLEQELNAAKQKKQIVLLDFYADWCSSCLAMDRRVFSRSDVQTALHSFRKLRIDLTANNAFDQAVLKQFDVIGPPTMLFFDKEGQELTSQRIVGEVSPTILLLHINKIKEAN